jgi:hypothetical protein
MEEPNVNGSLVVLRLSRSFRESFNIQVNRSQLSTVAPLMTWYVDNHTTDEDHRLAYFTEEQTLYNILVPLPPSITEQSLTRLFLNRLEKLCRECHLPFDSNNCTVVFTERSDRRIISSQVNLMDLSNDYLDGTTPEAINRAERDLNVTPMGLLKMDSPLQRLKSINPK